MLDNHVYNLIQQLAEESKTAWRTTQYIKDAGDCDPCKTFWLKLKAGKETEIRELTAMIQSHLQTQNTTASPQKPALRRAILTA